MNVKHVLVLLIIGLLGIFLTSVISAADIPGGEIDFNRDIRPILSDNCFACHGPDAKSRKAKLRLDTQAGSRTDLGGYEAIVPGKLDDSEMWLRLVSKDKKEVMPPIKSGKKLKAQERALIKRWIEQGGDYAEHWAYAASVKTKPPVANPVSWSRNSIDQFILARLNKENLKPSPDADRVTLIRRLYFDIIGLPPTPMQVDAFVNDKSPRAYEKVVDHLLASPHYGERMAIKWLDLVRYADTVGYHGDQDQNISPYRDYVIKSFNENLPFDQFTIEQIAGDLLINPTMWQKIATGYNRLLQTTHEGGLQPAEYLAKYFSDRVRNVSGVWLGSTVGCAECHNHKYDPFTQKEFYSLGAFFADVDEAKHFKNGTNSLPTRREPELKSWNLQQHEQVQLIEKQLQNLAKSKAVSKEDGLEKAKKVKALQAQKASIEKQYKLCMITQSIKPRAIRVLPRGDFLNLTGEVVKPSVPAFLGSIKKVGSKPRLDFAKWIASGDNPLTSRVFVNRLWAMFYGKGLSASLADFGAQGEAPSHAKLLDWLAVEFVDTKWDVKRMIKLMVMSRAYQQSSLVSAQLQARDADNRLLARQSRYRMQAEVIRDNALAVAGLLDRSIGGASVKPYQPAGYYRNLNFPQRRYKADMNGQQYRRGVYMHWQRQFLHPMLRAFDAPSREECAVTRPRSNTPLSALVLMNDPSFVEAGRAFSVRIVREGGKTPDQRIAWAWKQVFSRKISASELRVLRLLVANDLAEYRKDAKSVAALMTVGMYKVPSEVDQIEVAGWMGVARTILNLNETITRN
jgi:hypothetical protein